MYKKTKHTPLKLALIGGGINSPESARQLVLSGANYIVTGTQLELNPSLDNLLSFTKAIHKP